MKWRKKQQPPHKKKAEEIKETPFMPTPPPTSSSIFSFSTWISKIKMKMTSNSTGQRRSATGPHQKRLLSPPRSKSDRHPDVARRLSVGDEDAHLVRSRTCRIPPLPRPARNYSASGELDFEFRSDLGLGLTASPAPDPAVRRWRNADRWILEEIEVDSNPIQLLDPIEIGDRKGENRSRTIKSGRRSFSGKVRPRVRVYSPRLRPKRRSATMGVGEERNSNWERYSPQVGGFAVVKSSSDPTRDFRESMVEMIREKGIQRLEELERLLACYLSLNSDEHHDVIVKVFRQVWFDLNREARRRETPV